MSLLLLLKDVALSESTVQLATVCVVEPLNRMRVLRSIPADDDDEEGPITEPTASLLAQLRCVYSDAGCGYLFSGLRLAVAATLARWVLRPAVMAFVQSRMHVTAGGGPLLPYLVAGSSFVVERALIHPLMVVNHVQRSLSPDELSEYDASHGGSRMGSFLPLREWTIARKIYATSGIQGLYSGLGARTTALWMATGGMVLFNSFQDHPSYLAIRFAVTMFCNACISSPAVVVNARLAHDAIAPPEKRRYPHPSIAPSLDVLIDILDKRGLWYLLRDGWVSSFAYVFQSSLRALTSSIKQF